MDFDTLTAHRELLDTRVEQAEEMYANVFSKWSNAIRANRPQEDIDALEIKSCALGKKNNRLSTQLNKCKIELSKRKCERIFLKSASGN
jgi:hypothetical protein